MATSTVFPSTRKTTHYGRLSRLFVDMCPCLLRDKLEQHIPLVQFSALILKKKKQLKPILNISQKQLLYPSSGKFAGTYDDFDLSLLYILLRNLCGITAHSNGWGKDPYLLDRSESANIERLRIARNKQYGHLIACSVDESTFITIWSEIRQAVVELETTLPAAVKNVDSYKDEIDILEKTTMDPENEQQYIELLEKQQNVDLETRELVRNVTVEFTRLHEQLKATTVAVDTMRNMIIPKHIQAEQVDVYISTWQNEEQFFVETQAYRHAHKTLTQGKHITITGNSGAGKSAIAHHLALSLHREGYTIVPVVAADEIRNYADPSQKQVFVFDDPVGKESLDVMKLAQFDSCNDYIMTMLDKMDMKVVFTCRKQVLTDKKYMLSRTVLNKNIVDLHKHQLTLSEEEKLNIFEMYTKDMKFEILESTKRLVTHTECFNFPFLCKMFGVNEQFQKKEKEFFSNMFSVLVEELEMVSTRERVKYCGLVLCMMYDDDFNITILDAFSSPNENEMVQHIFEACGLSRSTSRVEIQFAMEGLVNVYLIQEGSRYRFIHDTLYEATAYSFGKRFPRQMVKHCSSNFLRERIRVTQPEEGQHIVIQEGDYEYPSDRIISEMRKGNVYDVFLNPLMSDGSFLKCFIHQLGKLPTDDIKNIFIEIKPDLDKVRQCLEMHEDVLSSHLTLLCSENVKAIHWIFAKDMKELLAFLFSKLYHFRKNIRSKFINIMSHIKHDKSKMKSCLSFVSAACLGGNTKTVAMLLKNGKSGSLNDTWDVFRMSTLHMAVISCNTDMVKMVLGHGVCVNTVNSGGFTSLNIAAALGLTEISTLLLANGADLNICAFDGQSPLYTAVMHGHTATVSLLLGNTACVNLIHKNGASPLFMAVSYGFTDITRLLLEHKALKYGPTAFNVVNDIGQSALFVASMGGHQDIVTHLLDEGADVNLCSVNGDSPLIVATKYNNFDVVKLLLNCKADTNIVNKRGQTALFIASTEGYSKIVKLLLEKGTDVIDCLGFSPLIAVILNDHGEVVELLVKYNSEKKEMNTYGETVLIIAVLKQCYDVVKLLLENGTDVNLCNIETGDSSLIVATCEANHEIVELLLTYNADTNITNISGENALLVAVKEGHYNTVKLLLKDNRTIMLIHAPSIAKGDIRCSRQQQKDMFT